MNSDYITNSPIQDPDMHPLANFLLYGEFICLADHPDKVVPLHVVVYGCDDARVDALIQQNNLQDNKYVIRLTLSEQHLWPFKLIGAFVIAAFGIELEHLEPYGATIVYVEP